MSVVVVAAARSPWGVLPRSSLAPLRADDLAAQVLAALAARLGEHAAALDAVFAGTATPEVELAYNPARTIAASAGLPPLPCHTVSGDDTASFFAFVAAVRAVAAGDARIAAVVGVDAPSRVPYGGNDARPSPRLMRRAPEALTPLFTAAVNAAARDAIGRDTLNERVRAAFAAEAAARDAGRSLPARTPVFVPDDESGSTVRVADDDTAAPGEDDTPVISGAAVARRHAAPAADGAAVLLIADAAFAAERKMDVLARIDGTACAAVDARTAPDAVTAAVRALRARGIAAEADAWFISEPSAVHGVLAARALGIAPERLNPEGSALSHGHAFGASGARLLVDAAWRVRAGAAHVTAAQAGVGGQGAAAALSTP